MLVYMNWYLYSYTTEMLLERYPRRRRVFLTGGKLCYVEPSSIYKDIEDIVRDVAVALVDDVKVAIEGTHIVIRNRDKELSVGFSLYTDIYTVPDAACEWGAGPFDLARDIEYLYRRLGEIDIKPAVSSIATYEITYSQAYTYNDMFIRELEIEVRAGLPIANIVDVYRAVEDVVALRLGATPLYDPEYITDNVVRRLYSMMYDYGVSRDARTIIEKNPNIQLVIYFPDLDHLKAFIDMLLRMTPTPP